jgi:hypothetical protein
MYEQPIITELSAMNKMEETNLAIEGQVKCEKTFDMFSR